MGGIRTAVGLGEKMGAIKKAAPASTPTTAAAKSTEDTEVSEIETDSGMMQKKKKGKKALTLSPAAANVGGEGSSGLNIPTS